jgi:hypothetical protein
MEPKSNHWGLVALALLLGWWYLRSRKVAPAAAVAATPAPPPEQVQPIDHTAASPTLFPSSLSDDGLDVSIDSAPPSGIPEVTDVATGFQSFGGYGMGDYSNAALAVLARQSQWHLALTPSAHASPYGSPMSLWQEWVNIRDLPQVGSQWPVTEAVRDAIAAAFDGYSGLVDGMNNPVPESFKGW